MSKTTRSHLLALMAIVGSTFVLSSCDRMLEWAASSGPGTNLGAQFSRLGGADRVVIGNVGTTVKELTSPADIRRVLAFFRRHPDHWLAISGVFPDYDIAVFEGDTRLVTLGIGAGSRSGPSQSTISFDDFYQRLPTGEIAEFANELGLAWPPPRRRGAVR